MASPRTSQRVPSPRAGRKTLHEISWIKGKALQGRMHHQSLEERLARFVTRTRSQGDQPPLEIQKKPLTEIEAKQITRLLAKKADREKRRIGHAVKSITRAMSVIPDALLLKSVLVTNGENRPPTVYEMAACAMLKYGANAPEFREYLLKMHSLYQKHRVNTLWTSSPQPILEALTYTTPHLTQNLIMELESLLLQKKGERLTTKDMAAALRIPWKRPENTHISVALGLLSAAKYVRLQPGMPIKVQEHGAALPYWTHRGHPNLPPEKKNPHIRALDLMNQGTILLGRKTRIKSGRKTETIPSFDYKTLYFLRKHGLAKNDGIRWSITPKGKRLMELAEKRNELPEELRQILNQPGKKKEPKRQYAA